MEKTKLFFNSEKGKDILIVIIVILVGLGSFELGRLSKEDDSQSLKINDSTQNSDNTSQVSQLSVDNSPDVGRLEASRRPTSGATSSNKPFFASSKGKKYYTIDCTAGKNIKEVNKVYFSTGEEAEAAGYTLSSSCN
jgi:hypothetical protein